MMQMVASDGRGKGGRVCHVVLEYRAVAYAFPYLMLSCVTLAFFSFSSSKPPTFPRPHHHHTSSQIGKTMGGALSQLLRSTWLANLMWMSGSILALGLGALYYFQDQLLYHPSIPGMPQTPRENPPGYRSPADHGIHDYEEHFIKTDDGATIHAWLLLHPDSLSLPTVVYFHGNAGNMGFRLPHGSNLFKQCRVNVLLMDYRGYGSSKGIPSEHGLLSDARAVLATLQAHPRVASDRIVLYGKSLGGAVALAVTEVKPDDVLALVLENTFLSIPAMVDVLMPLVKVFKGFILRIGWHSDRRVALLSQPMLFMSGLNDELVPPAHMRELKERATSSVWTQLYTVADGTHNDTWHKGGIAYYRTYRDFIGRVMELLEEGKVGRRRKEGGKGACAETGLRGKVEERKVVGGSVPIVPSNSSSSSRSDAKKNE